jgi:two-component system sensor kinase FixL
MGKTLEGIVTSWNRAAEHMFGYTPDEIVGRSVTMLFPDDLIGEEAMILDRLRRGDRIEHYETVRRHKDGRPVDVSLTVSPIFDANRVVIGASKSARDISERIALSKRLDELQSELLHTSRVNEMGQLASALAHELNQPLAAVALFVGGARRHVELGNIELAVEGCKRAESEVMRTSAILGRLGSFMKKGPMKCQREVLVGVLDDAIALSLLGPNGHDLKIEVRIADDAQIALLDRIQIQQVLMNLIRNAAQAMEGRAVRSMSISARRMDAEMIAIEVCDDGPGLSPNVLEHMFEPFQTTKPEGMGIGLSLCQNVVRAHGGEMAAANAAGGGAVFVFTLMTPPHVTQ